MADAESTPTNPNPLTPEGWGDAIRDSSEDLDGSETEVGEGCLVRGCLFGLVSAVALVLGAVAIFLGLNAEDAEDINERLQEELDSVFVEEPDLPLVEPGFAGFDNEYDEDGNLVPIDGIWDVYNGDGVDTCKGDTPLEAYSQEGQIKVIDGGDKIELRELVDGELAPGFILERIAGSATEAVYYADLSEETGMDKFEMTLTFTSSSKLDGKLDGCPNREGDGLLIEPTDE